MLGNSSPALRQPKTVQEDRTGDFDMAGEVPFSPTVNHAGDEATTTDFSMNPGA
jgi:hypothetical protein